MENTSKTERQEWINILSSCNPTDLVEARERLNADVYYNHIVEPETGLIMVQARADGSDSRFNMGEATVSKCVLEVEERYLGYGMVMGSDLEHAELAALFDGLLQHPDFQDDLKNNLINSLKEKQKQRDESLKKQAADTRVEFFTLKRGE